MIAIIAIALTTTLWYARLELPSVKVIAMNAIVAGTQDVSEDLPLQLIRE